MKISLDSNCFRDPKFIDFLTQNSNSIEIHIPIIALIETLIWYKLRGLKLDDFEYGLNRLNAKIDLLNKDIGDKISDIVIAKEKIFPFKVHARDYFIGAIAEFNNTILITYNTNHFNRLQVKVLTPEELIISFLNQK